jgi:hypothetical protein
LHQFISIDEHLCGSISPQKSLQQTFQTQQSVLITKVLGKPGEGSSLTHDHDQMFSQATFFKTISLKFFELTAIW